MRPRFLGRPSSGRPPAFALRRLPPRGSPDGLEGTRLERYLLESSLDHLVAVALANPMSGDKAADLMFRQILEKIGPDISEAQAMAAARLVPLVRDVADVGPGIFADRIFSEFAAGWREDVAASGAAETLGDLLETGYYKFRGEYLHELFPPDTLDRFPSLKDDGFPFRPHLGLADQRTTDYLRESSGFYLGKYMESPPAQAATTKWLEKFYIEQGRALDSPEGIRLFKEQFPGALALQDWQVRRIIDTSVSNTRNFAHVESLVDAGAKTYAIAGPVDNLTCDWCVELVGQTFTVAAAKEKVEQIKASEPGDLPTLRPFLTSEVPADLLEDLKARMDGVFPPFHPHCRHRIVVDQWAEPGETQTIKEAENTPRMEEGTHFDTVTLAPGVDSPTATYAMGGAEDAGLVPFFAENPIGDINFYPGKIPGSPKALGLASIGGATNYKWIGKAPKKWNWGKLAGFTRNAPAAGKVGRGGLWMAGQDAISVGAKKPLGTTWTISARAGTRAEIQRRVFTHELFHHVHFSQWDTINPAIVAGFNASKKRSMALRKSNGLKNVGADKRKMTSGVSIYGETNHLEWWTESASAYVYERELFRAHAPEDFRAIEAIFKTLGITPKDLPQ